MFIELNDCVWKEEKELGIYVRKHFGQLTYKSFLETLVISRELELPLNLKLLEDYRNAVFSSFKRNIMPHVITRLVSEVARFNNVRMAFLHSSPKIQVISEIIKSNSRDIPGFDCEVFTTEEGAIRWLNYEI